MAEEKGLPKYSIKGGICNRKGCLKICVEKSNIDDIWYCEEHAREKVKRFINTFKQIGYPVV